MASLTEKNLARQAVSNVTETLYTAPASTTTIIKDIHICNNGGTRRWFSIWLVPNGDSATDENVLFFEFDIPANDFVHTYASFDF